MPLSKARLRISDYNEKRKKNLSGKEHKARMVALSLTSMVDMFAILVIFLLTNSGTVQSWIEVGHQIELPRARSSDPPPKGTTFNISKEAIYAENEKIAQTSEALKGPLILRSIVNWLSKQPKEVKKLAYVNVVGDKSVPFGVMRRVIASCEESGFKNVNLAVQPQ